MMTLLQTRPSLLLVRAWAVGITRKNKKTEYADGVSCSPGGRDLSMPCLMPVEWASHACAVATASAVRWICRGYPEILCLWSEHPMSEHPTPAVCGDGADSS